MPPLHARQGLTDPVTTPNTAASAITRPAPPDLALLLLVAASSALEALALLLRPVLAHAIALALLVAGWQPGQRSAAPAPSVPTAPTTHRSESEPAAVQPPASALAELPVRELRQLARDAGHRALARSGRRPPAAAPGPRRAGPHMARLLSTATSADDRPEGPPWPFPAALRPRFRPTTDDRPEALNQRFPAALTRP